LGPASRWLRLLNEKSVSNTPVRLLTGRSLGAKANKYKITFTGQYINVISELSASQIFFNLRGKSNGEISGIFR